ncbi:PAAR-like domain-containing protein [Erwinia sp.]|uniref:PAAR-like domain-containing protein n=1 Tax=Erwinia citreus TaxID=558 RepID=UPI002896560B|nr:PAAR-like domain-containing protein [Erwinia sp.]
MAENYAARKDGAYKVVGMAPDACFTPGIPSPVPYPVTTTLAPATNTVNSVNFKGRPAFVYEQSFVPTTIGDAAGSNKGVVSGTVEGDCWSIEHSPDTFIGGHAMNRVSDLFAMNGKATGGRGGALTKRETWERRKALIAKGKQSSDPKVRAAAERLELNNTGVEKARLAKDVYGTESNSPSPELPPEGWKDISNNPEELSKYGLTEEDLENKDAAGLKVKVYQPDEAVFGKDMSASVVFRGTRMTSGEDWKNNAYQGMGFKSPYYQQSVSIGKKIRASSLPVDCTGHSLGGGLASACSRSSGRPGWTYNAAGLNPGTVEKYGGKNYYTGSNENINAYRVKGEILTAVQEPGFWGGLALMGTTAALGAKMGGLVGGVAGLSVGGLLAQLPDSVGKKHDMDGGKGDPVARHGMIQVIPCIEAEKDIDENILNTL